MAHQTKKLFVASRPLRALPAVLLLAAVVVPTLDRGGFSSGGQGLLIVLAALGMLSVLLVEPDLRARLPASASIAALAGLGCLQLVSLAWTSMPASDTLRLGLLTLAYVALAGIAAVLASHVGARPCAIALMAMAGGEAVLGIGAAALHHLPEAERIGRAWRPGGTFEYPPALALLQVMALPPLLGRLSLPRLRGAGAATGLALAGVVLGTAESRLEVVLGALVVALLAVRVAPRARGDRSDRLAVPLGGAGLLASGGVGGHLILGRALSHAAGGGSLTRCVLVASLVVGLGLAWSVGRRARRTRVRRALARPRLLLALAVIALATGLALSQFTGSGAAKNQRGGVTHGRTAIWRAALNTWGDRPLLGAGAGSFATASVRHQRGSPTAFAHNLPLESAAELGVLGLALSLALYGGVPFDLWRRRMTGPVWCLGPGVVAFLLANLVDWPWHLSGLAAIWAATLGTAVGASPRPGEPSATSEPAARSGRSRPISPLSGPSANRPG